MITVCILMQISKMFIHYFFSYYSNSFGGLCSGFLSSFVLFDFLA